MSRRVLDAAFAAALFAASIWFWAIADGFPQSPRYAQIDTDYWPKIVFGIMILVTGCITVQSIMALFRSGAASPEESDAGPDWGTIGRMAAIAALVLAYYIAFNRLGFVISTLLFVWAAAFMLPSGKTWVKVVFSPILTLILTVVFAHLLGLPLPRGIGPFYDLSLMIF